jgi:ferric-dicitrate binding protein FerR (iron transport regulator)
MSTRSERSVEQLMKLAGEREMPAADAMERARLAAHDSWQKLLRQRSAPVPAPRRWLRISLGLAAAASVVFVALLAFVPPAAPPPQVSARVVSLEGGALSHGRAGDTVVFSASDVMAGTTLETVEGRVALTLDGALSLRMNRHTRLRFDSPSGVTLLAGDIYVDSGGVNAAGRLRIETPAGVVRHVGTQFQVFVARTNTRVRVREGRVLFTPLAAGEPQAVAAGDELRVADGRAEFTRGLPAFGAEWEWTAAITPPFDIESRPLAEFLAWAAREHGWQIRYASETLQEQTYEIRLHGALDPSNTDAMIERMSLITGVPLQIRNGVLWVGAAR